MTGDELLALALRVEQATGPDRELDQDMFCELGLAPFVDGAYNAYRAPAYTASIDAAMSLVPEGYHCGVRWHAADREGSAFVISQHASNPITGRAATPALALTAACLRALAGRAE